MNTARRMESHGVPDQVQVTERVVRRLNALYAFEPRGRGREGQGPDATWLLVGPRG